MPSHLSLPAGLICTLCGLFSSRWVLAFLYVGAIVVSLLRSFVFRFSLSVGGVRSFRLCKFTLNDGLTYRAMPRSPVLARVVAEDFQSFHAMKPSTEAGMMNDQRRLSRRFWSCTSFACHFDQTIWRFAKMPDLPIEEHN